VWLKLARRKAHRGVIPHECDAMARVAGAGAEPALLQAHCRAAAQGARRSIARCRWAGHILHAHQHSHPWPNSRLAARMHLTCTLGACALTGAACCALQGDSLAIMRLHSRPKHQSRQPAAAGPRGALSSLWPAALCWSWRLVYKLSKVSGERTFIGGPWRGRQTPACCCRQCSAHSATGQGPAPRAAIWSSPHGKP
jgi:hypothetical protein